MWDLLCSSMGSLAAAALAMHFQPLRMRTVSALPSTDGGRRGGVGLSSAPPCEQQALVSCLLFCFCWTRGC